MYLTIKLLEFLYNPKKFVQFIHLEYNKMNQNILPNHHVQNMEHLSKYFGERCCFSPYFRFMSRPPNIVKEMVLFSLQITSLYFNSRAAYLL